MADTLNIDEVIQRTTPSGKSPNRRVANANAAQASYKRERSNSAALAMTRAKIQGLYDGNPPRSRADARRRGEAWMANVDWGEFRANIRLNAASLWNMLVSSPELISANTDHKDPQDTNETYELAVSRRFSEMLRDWKPFHHDVFIRAEEMLKHGVSTAFWENSIDWRSKPVRSSNVIVPDKTSSRPGSLPMLFLRDEITLEKLYENIETKKSDAEDDGWNINRCRRAIVDMVNAGQAHGNDTYNISEWESMQQHVKNQSDGWSTEFDDLRIVHVLAEELSEDKTTENKLSHYIILENDDDQEGSYQFLYEHNREFLNMDTMIHTLMFHVGEGFFKSIKGLGREIFHGCHASNRLINTVLDGTMIGTGLLLQAATPAAGEQLSIIRKSGATVLPSNVQAQQQQIGPAIQPAMFTRGMLNSVMGNNVGMYKNTTENTAGVARTAKEVEIQAANEARFENNQAEWYYVQWEGWLQETFRRVMNPEYSKDDSGYDEHKWLFEKLKEDGVPATLLDPKQWKIKAVRAIGLGSLNQRFAITNQMMSMLNTLDEEGQNNVVREWFAARVSWENVDKFVPRINRDEIFTMNHSLAEGENNDMVQGQARTTAADHPHAVHLNIHFKGALKIVQKVFQGQVQNIMAEAQALGLHVQHIATHLQYVKMDKHRQQQAAKYEGDFKKLLKAFEQIQAAAEKAKKQQEKQQEEQQRMLQEAQELKFSRELEEKIYAIDKEAEVEKYKADQLNEARESKTAMSNYVSIQRLQAEIEAMGMRLNAELSAKQAKENNNG